MYKIECLTLNNALSANTYKTPKGNEYLFQNGVPTEIKDKEDANFFLNAGKGKLFADKGTISKVKEAVDKVINGKKEVPKEIEVEPGKKKPNPAYDWDYESLKDLNKNEQVSLIRDLAGGGQTVPALEDGRIKFILKVLNQEDKKEDKKTTQGDN